MTLIPTFALLAPLAALACSPSSGVPAAGLPELPQGVQAISLLGDTLRTPELPPDVREEREARLAEAQVAYERDPASANAVIWLGRRWGYLGEYRRAVAVFSEGIARHPRDARLYRHRGHRYVTLRLLDRAVDDLTQAASLVEGGPDEVEPDGLPNLRNIPTSTLQTNIWYHLGLAHYLLGHFEEALAAYRRCLALSTNPDMLVATTHWLYMTLRRLGRDAEAEAVLEPIHAGMDIIENGAYHKLVLMYKGEITPGALLAEADGTDALESATLAYGIGNFHLHNGRPDEARTVFRRIVAGSEWAAFGYLAAEAELARGNP